MRVLIASNYAETRAALPLLLASKDFFGELTESADEALSMLQLYDYDALILDHCLDDMSGASALGRLRESRIRTPCIFLAWPGAALDRRIAALDSGADDVLTVPFDSDELIARVRALVRRSKGHACSIIQVGNLSVNIDRRTADCSGMPVQLTGREYLLLELLAMRVGQTLSQEVLLAGMYGGMDEPEMKIIDVFVCKLRKKLKLASGGLNFIETVWGRGYRLREPEGCGEPPKHRPVGATAAAIREAAAAIEGAA